MAKENAETLEILAPGTYVEVKGKYAGRVAEIIIGSDRLPRYSVVWWDSARHEDWLHEFEFDVAANQEDKKNFKIGFK